jgi:hypothetical protein
VLKEQIAAWLLHAAFPLILAFSLGEKEGVLRPAWNSKAALTHPVAGLLAQRIIRTLTLQRVLLSHKKVLVRFSFRRLLYRQMNMTDGELLQRYVRDRSESAFARATVWDKACSRLRRPEERRCRGKGGRG